MKGERDYPIGHPAASDYNGEPYAPLMTLGAEDFPPGDPARGGGNVTSLHTPDGMRASLNAQAAELHELAPVGSLPRLKDPTTGEAIELTPAQLALVYRVRQSLRTPLAAAITSRYQLAPQEQVCVCGLPEGGHAELALDHKFKPWKPETPAATLSEKDQALGFIRSMGFTPEHAEEILAKYGIPEVMKDREAALSR